MLDKYSFYRQRINKNFTRKYRCGKCGGSFKVINIDKYCQKKIKKYYIKVLTLRKIYAKIKLPSKNGTQIKEMAYNGYNRMADTESEFTEN